MRRAFASLIIGLMAAFVYPLSAQQTTFYKEANRLYSEGLELYYARQYGPARLKLEQLQGIPEGNLPPDHGFRHATIDYFIAHCATELYQPDAEKRLLDFLDEHPHSGEIHMAYHDLGVLKYRDRRYREAIEWFEQVDERMLTTDRRELYRFQLGYSYFTLKKLDQAETLFEQTRLVENRYYYPSNYYAAYIAFLEERYDDAMERFRLVEGSEMFADELPFFVNQIHFMEGRYEEITRELPAALEREDTRYKKELGRLLGQAWFELENYEEAEPWLAGYLESASSRTRPDIYRMGLTYYKNRKYDDAIGWLSQLGATEDSLAQYGLFQLGNAYLAKGKKEAARQAYSSAAREGLDQSVHEEALFLFGKLSLELGEYSDAVSAMSRFGESFPNAPLLEESFELLTQALLQTKNYPRAIELIEQNQWKNRRIQHVYQKVTYFRAVELFNDGMRDESFELAEKSIGTQLDKGYLALAHFLQGDIRYGKAAYDAARASYGQFAELFPSAGLNPAAGPNLLRANYNIAYSWFKQDQFSNALTYFRRAIERKPGNAADESLYDDALVRAGDCAFLKKDYALATSMYDRIIAGVGSQLSYAFLQKALILGLQRDFDGKVRTLEQLIREHPDSRYRDRAIFEKAVSLQEDLGRYEEALATYQRLIDEYPKENPLRPEALHRMGLIYINQGKLDRAIATYERIIRDYPNTEISRQTMPVLREVYVNAGDPEGYFEFVSGTAGLAVSASEQDSVLYESAQNFYIKGDCAGSLRGFTKYLAEFPKGVFALDAHFKRAECLYESGQYAEALPDYAVVSGYATNSYTETSCNKGAWIAYFQLADYGQALALFQQLETVASNEENRQRSLVGQMRCHFQLEDAASLLIQTKRVREASRSSAMEVLEAHFYEGECYRLWKQDAKKAIAAYGYVSQNTRGEKGAEALYYQALIRYEKMDYAASRADISKLRKEFGSYEVWVIRSFILLAESHAAEENYFQAIATLESVVNNYRGDEELLQAAKDKLDEIKAAQQAASGVEDPEAGSDSMQFREP